MEFFKNRTGFSIVLSLLVILYCVYSIAMLWVAYVAKTNGGEIVVVNQNFVIFHSVASYILVILVTVYHLYTFIRRRKRRNDHPDEAPGSRATEAK